MHLFINYVHFFSCLFWSGPGGLPRSCLLLPHTLSPLYSSLVVSLKTSFLILHNGLRGSDQYRSNHSVVPSAAYGIRYGTSLCTLCSDRCSY